MDTNFKKTIENALLLLDMQRKYAIDSGAEYTPGHIWIGSRRAGDQSQITYYNGHANMIEYMLTGAGYLKVDNNNVHYIEWID